MKIGSYSLRELALRDITITSPEHLGSHVVIKAKSVSLHPRWGIFKGAAPSLQLTRLLAPTLGVKILCPSTAAHDSSDMVWVNQQRKNVLLQGLSLHIVQWLQGSPCM